MNDHRILFVDDDVNILQSCQRQLRKLFAVETANSPAEGLRLLEKHGPFGVVVSDMRMPEMDGVQFLTHAQRFAPDTVRVMLTGNADQQTAIDAVNSGRIFRFLTKPCPPDRIIEILTASLEQYRLVIAERELLKKTFSGSVALLTDVLSLVKPEVFGRAARIKRLVSDLCRHLPMGEDWEFLVAGMLCQVGCITVPEELLAKVWSERELSSDESDQYHHHPVVAQRLLERIPRLDGIAQMIGRQFNRYVPAPEEESDSQRRIRLGASILKVAVDFEALMIGDRLVAEAVKTLVGRCGEYDPQILKALVQTLEIAPESQTIMIQDLQEGMVLDQDVVTRSGNVLVARGQEMTAWLCERLRKAVDTASGVRQPIHVFCRHALAK